MLRAILSIITQVMAMLALSQVLTTALISFRWQVKAITIYNILGGTVEAWWSASPVIIAINVSMEDIWFIGKLFCGALALIFRAGVKKDEPANSL